MSARMKGRRRQADAVIEFVTEWAEGQSEVHALALVGSYAYGRPRMGSDVDLMLLTTDRNQAVNGIDWIAGLDPGARLIRVQTWGPVTERRVRLGSGLHVELGVTGPEWAAVPLDPGTVRVLSDGCRILYDPARILSRAIDAL